MTKMIHELFAAPLKVVNLGLEQFYEAVAEQNVTVCQVDWKPPAGGNPRLIEILEKLNG